MRDLAAIGPLHHRVPITEALIAAAATERGVGVLHDDEHFDRLAAVLGFESRWIVEREAVGTARACDPTDPAPCG